MGQGTSNAPETVLSYQVIDKAVQEVYGKTQPKREIKFLYEPIIKLSHDAIAHQFMVSDPKGLTISETWLKIVYSPNYNSVSKELLLMLIQKLQELICRKVQMMISREEYRICLSLANFLIYYTDENNLKTTNLLSVRTDLNPDSQKLLQEDLIDELFFLKFTEEEVDTVDTCLRTSLMAMIQLRMKLFARSEVTLSIISRLEQSLFVLYCKLLYSPHPELLRRGRSINFKSNCTIAAYFIGVGANFKISSIYELAITFCTSILNDNPAAYNKQNKVLPSHLFKNLPIVVQNCTFQHILCSILHSMSYTKDKENQFLKFLFNRISSMKLAEMIFRHSKCFSPQLTYFLEELSLQVKNVQIERAYLMKIVEEYLKSSQDESAILKTFVATKEQRFNIRYAQKDLKISNEDLITELEGGHTELANQCVSLCRKYIQEVLLHNRTVICYDEKLIWSEILPKMLENSENNLSESSHKSGPISISLHVQREKRKELESDAIYNGQK